MATRISVIIPVRNEEPFIEQTLHHVLDQKSSGIDLEILVVDGNSTDNTIEVVKRVADLHSYVTLLHNAKCLSSSARNIGIRNSTGEFLVIIDGHCEIRSRTYFLDLIEAFERTGADCLGRPQPLDVTGATTFQKAVAVARSSPLGHHPDSFIYSQEEVVCPAASVAIAYKRGVFDQVGLFDESFDACEDYELNTRIDNAGLCCYLVPKLAANYKPRSTLRGLFRQLSRYGRGRIRLFRKHRTVMSIKTILPAVMLVAVFIGPLICTVLPILWPVYFFVLTLYLILISIESLRLAVSERSVRVLPWLPTVFMAIHFGSGWGLLREYLSFPK